MKASEETSGFCRVSLSSEACKADQLYTSLLILLMYQQYICFLSDVIQLHLTQKTGETEVIGGL